MRRLLLLLLLLAVAGDASARPLEEGRAAEERYAFAEALALYDEAPAGAERAAWLRARSEGSFEPLTELEHARRDPGADVDRLAVAADAYPPGLVRAEAWVFAADTHARRGRVAAAIPLWRKAARDPKADPVLAHAAIRSAVRAHLEAGDLAEASVDLEWLDDAGAAKDVARAQRRRYVHYACILAIVVVLGAAGRGARRLTTRAIGPVLAFSAFVALAGACLAWGYEGASAAPFLWFGLALVPLLLAARAWRRGPRALRAAACALSVLAAAFLVLEQTGHLDGLGL